MINDVPLYGEPEVVATAGWTGEVKGRPIDSLPQVVHDRVVATQTSLVVQDTAADPLFAGMPAVHEPSRPIKNDLQVIGQPYRKRRLRPACSDETYLLAVRLRSSAWRVTMLNG
ncbi:hypothetical protein [Pleomorphomonas koreensis]|uniref:hypothetical protein n=1 Tax=Pleomorphomonas koreensis TaxID=257440 RepID=UPI0004008B3D|nr:hypothetical protein [Pleomorphomonas koreensis]